VNITPYDRQCEYNLSALTGNICDMFTNQPLKHNQFSYII